MRPPDVLKFVHFGKRAFSLRLKGFLVRFANVSVGKFMKVGHLTNVQSSLGYIDRLFFI